MNLETKKILAEIKAYQTNMEFVRDSYIWLQTVQFNFQHNERLKKRLDDILESLHEVTCALANEFSKENFADD